MRRYNPKEVEPKWQKIWEESKLYETSDESDTPKYYDLEFFPYPSAATLHVGHVRNYTISDTWARYMRMRGRNVMHPMGWDAFGLPAENYAIKNGIQPRQLIAENIQIFKRQFKQMGFSHDWSRELDSSQPDYYKWTQWQFLKFLEKGIAYRAEAMQNWCPKDQTVLANEQVISSDGKNVCERCGTEVTQKKLSQWFMKITDYADRLLDDLEGLDWPENIKAMQRNWIGKSQGAKILFKIEGSDKSIEIFTTRPDTIYGATFLVLAPEHPMSGELITSGQKSATDEYLKQAKNKTELERQAEEDESSGAFTGSHAINPVNGEKIPIWIADYVLGSYGTGAIMAVPAHDIRDGKFAAKYGLAVVTVINAPEGENGPFEGEGELIASGKFNGLASSEAREKIVSDLTNQKLAQSHTQYRLRDWTVSRQRYWGCPIPIIYCDRCGIQPVPESDLPVLLPENVEFEPTGQSPLTKLPDFVNTTCPNCDGEAKRETDTFDTFVDSSWYFLRFADAKNEQAVFDKSKVDHWLPVDMYIGGAEHAVVHLLYARFWTKVLYDLGLVSFTEPFKALRNQGMIGGADGRKMGKRYGNTVTPDELIEQGYGADALRLYELFIAPFDQGVPWNPTGIVGTKRFLDRVWVLVEEFNEEAGGDNNELLPVTHRTTKKVTEDLERFAFNTALAALMEMVNDLYKLKNVQPPSGNAWRESLKVLIRLLAPFAPHITEELWQILGERESVHKAEWPVWDENYVRASQVTLAVQINGKVRAEIEIPADIAEADAIQSAKSADKVRQHLDGKDIKKAIYVPGRLVSFVTD